MLTVLIRIIVICIFGLLGFLDLLVLKDAASDLIHRRPLKLLTGWSKRILIELVRRYNQHQDSLFENLMPTILDLILIITFYLANVLLMVDVLIAILIFTDGTELRNHFEKRPPFVIRMVMNYQRSNRKLHYSRIFLLAVITNTLISLLFMVLPYIVILIKV